MVTSATHRAATAGEPVTAAQDRIVRLEHQVSNVTTAVRALVHGLEEGQITGAGIDQTHVARLADEILIAAGTQPTRAVQRRAGRRHAAGAVPAQRVEQP